MPTFATPLVILTRARRYGDQDVCHIIAHGNGGADHIDNFIVGSASLNRSAGRNHDYIFAYHAGLEQTRAAVAASVALCGYSGPSAEELVRKGEDVWRTLRRALRQEDKDAAGAH